jgi:hypothetical protein
MCVCVFICLPDFSGTDSDTDRQHVQTDRPKHGCEVHAWNDNYKDGAPELHHRLYLLR